MGAAAAVVAPGRSLVAVARGLEQPTGLRSAAADPTTGRLVGLVSTGSIDELRSLTVDADGFVRFGRRLLTAPSSVSPIAVGAGRSGTLLLGATALTVAPSTAVPHPADAAVAAALEGEPHGPASLGPGATERLAPVIVHTDGRVLEETAPGLVTAALGPWSLRQHGPDEEADHLPTVSVRSGGAERVVVDGLGMAGIARLAGPAAAPVCTVAGGDGSVRVRALTGDRAVEVADDPTVAVTTDGRDFFATAGGRGEPVAVHRFDGARWHAHLVLPDTEATTEVLPVAGTTGLVLTGRSGSRYVEVGR